MFVTVASSAGRIRTYNQLVNSELRYRCATAEYITRNLVIEPYSSL